jgi:hypothetical protein
MALTTHPHKAPRLKKEYSYTSIPHPGLRGLFWGELYLYLTEFQQTWYERYAAGRPPPPVRRFKSLQSASDRVQCFGCSVCTNSTERQQTVTKLSTVMAPLDQCFSKLGLQPVTESPPPLLLFHLTELLLGRRVRKIAKSDY